MRDHATYPSTFYLRRSRQVYKSSVSSFFLLSFCSEFPSVRNLKNLMGASLASYQNNLHGPVERVLSSTVRNASIFAIFQEGVSKASYITIDTYTSGNNLLIMRSTQKCTFQNVTELSLPCLAVHVQNE